jgi:3-hydroxy acid dehydrogenase/malonic semialdehyde reductase
MGNRIALITGASAGIGLACAELFAESSIDLILFARRKEKLSDLASALENKFKIRTLIYECDVRNYNQVNEIITNLPDDWKNVDVLVNNAGKALGLSKIQDGELSDWEEMIDTNIKGLLYMSRCVLPGMVQRGSGEVINIGSIAGNEVYPNGNVYCGTKSAVHMISKSMNIDLNGTGVRVTNIAPGLVETEFSEVRFHGDSEKAKTVYKGYKPLEGKDVADVALFCINLPKHVNIQNIVVTPTDQASTTIVNKKL